MTRIVREKTALSSWLLTTDWGFIFFALYVFLLPFWKRIEFLTPYSYLEGRFIDYLTYSVYVFDVVFGVVLFFWILSIVRKKSRLVLGDVHVLYVYLLIFVLGIISLFFAQSILISLYYLVVMIGLLLVYLFVINHITTRHKLHIVSEVFVASVGLQSIIAILQFIKNASVGLSIVGEQILAPFISGVAKIGVEADNHIRAYGTFSHPNVLALFLVIGGFVALWLLFQARTKRERVYRGILVALIGIGLLLTFSRIAWVVAFIGWGGYMIANCKLQIANLRSYIVQNKRYALIIIGFIVVVGAYVFPLIWARINPTLASTWESWEVRRVVIEKSVKIIPEHPLGVGIGNFVINIAYELTGYPVWMAEPVHNTFLLIAVEIGILGLICFCVFLLFIGKKAQKAPHFLRHAFFAIIALMFFDHYFWDIRQAQVLMMLIFGIIVAADNYKLRV